MLGSTDVEKKAKEDLYKLKKILNEEEYKKTLEIAKEYWRAQDQKTRERGLIKDEKTGKTTDYWDKVAAKAEEFTNVAGQNSYVEWTTAQMDIFGAIYDLNRAIYYTPMMPNALHLLPNRISRLAEKISHASGRDPKVKAILAHSVTVDDKGVLTIKAYKDKVPFTDEQQQLFDSGVIAWAKHYGYDMAPNTNALLKDGKPLTSSELDELMQDPDRSLNAFLSGNFNLKCSPQMPAPRV